jgi:RNA 2',3'-cyclic 3'-phosphodiesterase
MFVAVPLDDESRHALAARLVDEVGADLPGRDVGPPNWHLTLRFIGDVEDPVVDRIVASLDAADLGEPFGVRWGGLGAFPNARRAQVLWVGVSAGEQALSDLAASVDDALAVAGVDPSDRPFRPHLTLSRFRPTESVADVVGRDIDLGVPMQVDRVTLYESRLRRGGAQYRIIDEFPLRA